MKLDLGEEVSLWDSFRRRLGHSLRSSLRSSLCHRLVAALSALSGVGDEASPG